MPLTDVYANITQTTLDKNMYTVFLCYHQLMLCLLQKDIYTS